MTSREEIAQPFGFDMWRAGISTIRGIVGDLEAKLEARGELASIRDVFDEDKKALLRMAAQLERFYESRAESGLAQEDAYAFLAYAETKLGELLRLASNIDEEYQRPA